ncbi:DUF3164 family protein [Roseivirga sp. UBA838]|uniref:DUF3164 family protein n=1 Tax=Roseivirga sp. UBA838 TaxID=1947393 RepID=UPI00257B4AA8|nr:DUF3164 family protein [Roseivirga sp. UBA838]|tara:strand:+ start:12311 stop:12925 length:615 start_codon:yes stop_codon:yes gene_type:complete
MQQKSKSEFWIDEKGNKIPYNRTTKYERACERNTAALLKKAQKASEMLADLKEDFMNRCEEAFQLAMQEMDGKTENQKSFTWYNFDRSIKVERSTSEPIKFDDLTIKACKDKLEEFMNISVEAKDEFVKEMVVDAFETSRGNLDTKKVMNLLRWRSKVKAPLFQDAMDLIEKAIRRPSSKVYYRIWVKDKQGEYQNVELNLSNI